MSSMSASGPASTGDGAPSFRFGYRHRREARRTVLERHFVTAQHGFRDIVWQQNPDRVLKFRPSNLHYYGWVPCALWRNFKATVFSEVYLHIQCSLLLLWMFGIHIWGMGVPDHDLATFAIMIGTPFLGGIFNFGMVVTFILGLFITLVINRWWTIRTTYTKLMGTTTDLCITVAGSIQNAEDPNDLLILRARTELTRLLNLGHLLVIGKADAMNTEFKKSFGLRSLQRRISARTKKLLGSATMAPRLPTIDSALSKPRDLLTIETMVNEGFMNRDEWTILNQAEENGLPRYLLVYYWAQALINECSAAGWVLQAPQTVPLMLSKLNIIVESGSSILTTIDSQLPYPYVHLVSFVVHIYLIVLSTWFGCFLHTGHLGETFVLENGTSIQKDTDHIKTSVWLVFWCYLLMIIANITFQGLLHMHALLDNPFGNHCAKFPLRANVSQVTNAARTMLIMSEKMPAAFGDIFKSKPDGTDSLWSSSPLPSQGSAYVDFLRPTTSGHLYRSTSVPAQIDCNGQADVLKRTRISQVEESPTNNNGSHHVSTSVSYDTNESRNLTLQNRLELKIVVPVGLRTTIPPSRYSSEIVEAGSPTQSRPPEVHHQ